MNMGSIYRGRFAPSPTGPLHAGSLYAAVASYLDAKAAGGIWLLRMEDIDPPREVPGAADGILRSLETHGLCWEGSVLYQSSRIGAYEAALETLAGRGLLFRCSCTRAALGPGGSCARRCHPSADDICSLRFEIAAGEGFEDLFLGSQPGAAAANDIVLKRKDGLYAYALAVVVDDAYQGITHVVRGCDLLHQTDAQRTLLQTLGAIPPAYGHFPVLRDSRGKKLSKQNGAPGIDDSRPLDNLRAALRALGQPSADMSAASAAELLEIATARWTRAPLCGRACGDDVYRDSAST